MSAGTISCEELRKLNVTGSVHVFDVRTPEEVQKGQIPNAVNIPVAGFEEALKMDAETFAKTFNVNKPNLDDPNFVVHCHMGRRGEQAAKIAAALGYRNVRNLTGGYKEWVEKDGK
ncbi:thiosulfate:glutathione sulfurtransferase [Pelodytes ibericus]